MGLNPGYLLKSFLLYCKVIFRRFPFPFVIVLCVIVTESDLAKIYEQKSLRVIKIIICTLEKLVCMYYMKLPVFAPYLELEHGLCPLSVSPFCAGLLL